MLDKKWDDRYLQKLAIFDHCHEVITLTEQHRNLKAVKSSVSQMVARQIEMEMCDLYLILDKRFSGSDIVKRRESRFTEKAGGKSE